MIYFSCIVTCYNRQDTIKRTIESILSQKHNFFEIIVIDDASTDQSVKVIQDINDDRIKIIKQNYNQGQNAALNKGIQNSKYDYLAFLDSDDIWLPEYLLEMSKTYSKNPNIGFAYCSLVNSRMWSLEGENKYAEVLDQGFLSSMITITAKKVAVIDIGSFDTKYKICQDDDFCFRLTKKYSFSVVKMHLSQIIGAANSMTKNKKAVATGWAFFFKNYKKDILFYCGNKTFSKHMLFVSQKFADGGMYYKSILYYLKAVFYFLNLNNNKFEFTRSRFIYLSKKIIKKNLSFWFKG